MSQNNQQYEPNRRRHPQPCNPCMFQLLATLWSYCQVYTFLADPIQTHIPQISKAPSHVSVLQWFRGRTIKTFCVCQLSDDSSNLNRSDLYHPCFSCNYAEVTLFWQNTTLCQLVTAKQSINLLDHQVSPTKILFLSTLFGKDFPKQMCFKFLFQESL